MVEMTGMRSDAIGIRTQSLTQGIHRARNFVIHPRLERNTLHAHPLRKIPSLQKGKLMSCQTPLRDQSLTPSPTGSRFIAFAGVDISA
eukprot:1342757-Pleurochrysis_carterae.AAC.3